MQRQSQLLDPGVINLKADDLRSFGSTILGITLDQARTFLLVKAENSFARAAQLLGRQQSSVQQQVNVLNNVFQRLAASPLIRAHGRPTELQVTPLGEDVAKAFDELLRRLQNALIKETSTTSNTVRLAATTFSTPALARCLTKVRELIPDVKVEVIPIRSSDLFTCLQNGTANISFGAVVLRDDESPSGRFEYIWVDKDEPGIITNLSEDELPDDGDGSDDLKSISDLSPLRNKPMLDYGSGVVDQMASKVEVPGGAESSGEGAGNSSNYSTDLRNAIFLLGSGLVKGYLLTLASIAQDEVGRSRVGNLRALRLRGEYSRLKIRVGLVSSSEVLGPLLNNEGIIHPVARFWRAFKTISDARLLAS